jgi:broad specificity phosphatase PhoE
LSRWFRWLTPVPLVFASSSTRAFETARLMVSSTPGGAVVQARDDLREIHCGELEGLPVGQLQAAYPELWRANLSQAHDHFRWPGGESYAELRARASAALNAIVEQHDAARLVVVTHAGLIAQILGMLHGTPAAAWGKWRPQNASVTTLTWGPEGVRMLAYDEVGHLAGFEPTIVTSSRSSVW